MRRRGDGHLLCGRRPHLLCRPRSAGALRSWFLWSHLWPRTLAACHRHRDYCCKAVGQQTTGSARFEQTTRGIDMRTDARALAVLQGCTQLAKETTGPVGLHARHVRHHPIALQAVPAVATGGHGVPGLGSGLGDAEVGHEGGLLDTDGATRNRFTAIRRQRPPF